VDQRAAAVEGDEAGVVRGAAAREQTMPEIREITAKRNTPIYVPSFLFEYLPLFDEWRLRIRVGGSSSSQYPGSRSILLNMKCMSPTLSLLAEISCIRWLYVSAK